MTQELCPDQLPISDLVMFPLPLTAFENFMVLNDRPEYPMVFEVHIDFAGTIDQETFQDALRQTCRRQVLFACKVVGRPFADAHWVYCPDWQPHIQWVDPHTARHPPSPPAGALRASPSLSIWAAAQNQSTHVAFQFHHAVTDGLGALEFIRELFHTYHQRRTPDATQPLPQPDYDEFPGRARLKQKPTVAVSPWQKLRSLVREAVLVLRQKPVPLALPSAQNLEPLSYGQLLTLQLTPHEFAAYRQQATRLQVNTNDLLLAHFFVTLAQWHKQHAASDQACLRITMPVSHHHRVHPNLPICNRINFAFLTRQLHEIESRPELLAGIARETQLIREHNLADHFATSLQTASRIPGLLRRLTSDRSCFATAVFSNVGDLSRHARLQLKHEKGQILGGDFHLERFLAAPPLQPNTRLAVCAITYARSLYLTFRFDWQHFSHQSANDFLALMRRVMNEPLA